MKTWNRTILCVDDEVGILEAYRDIFFEPSTGQSSIFLGRRGARNSDRVENRTPPASEFNVHLAQSGEQAIEILHELKEQGIHIAAAFIDMKMPGGIDGLETMRRLLALDEEINFAVVTAYTDRSIQQIADLFTDQDRWIYFNKPFTRGELQQAASNLTSAWNLRRERNILLERVMKTAGILTMFINKSAELHMIQHRQEFFRLIMSLSRDLFGAEHGLIAVYDAMNRPAVRASMGMYDGQSRENSGSALPPEIGDILRQCGDRPGELIRDGDRVVVPISIRGRTLGMLLFHTPKQGDDEHLHELVRLFSQNVATALDNLRLFHKNEEMHRELSALEQRKSQFIALVSHELRTPLVTLKGYADLMSFGEMGPQTDQQIKAMKTMKESTDRLSHLINQIISVARMETGGPEMKFMAARVDELVTSMLDAVEPFLGKRNLSVTTRLGRELPLIRADKAEMHKVFMNLMLNAIKYTPDGGSIAIEACASNESRRGGRCVRITFSDTGVGIPEEEHDRIFTRFYEVRPIEHHFSGTSEYLAGGVGLGLAIVKQIVNAHDGSVSLQSVPERGSSFSVEIPVWEDSEPR